MDFPAHKNWTRQEERRRLWWSIWELDSFAAAVACRRPTVDKRNMQVMIPVSDENWFSDTPVESDILDPSSSKSWRTLEKRENQDPRAWYLVANFILLSAHDLAQSKNSSQEEARALETAVACFFLIFPSDFNISSASLSFTKERYQRSNWIISINIMLQGIFVFLRLVNENSAASSFQNSKNHFLAPLASGPAAVNLRTAIEFKRNPKGNRQLTGLELELISLVLQNVARYWKVGSILTDIVQNVGS